MASMNCLFERVSKISIGLTLLLFGLGLIVIGLTVLPIFGLILAVPVLGASAYFIKAHLNKQCQIAE